MKTKTIFFLYGAAFVVLLVAAMYGGMRYERYRVGKTIDELTGMLQERVHTLFGRPTSDEESEPEPPYSYTDHQEQQALSKQAREIYGSVVRKTTDRDVRDTAYNRKLDTTMTSWRMSVFKDNDQYGREMLDEARQFVRDNLHLIPDFDMSLLTDDTEETP